MSGCNIIAMEIARSSAVEAIGAAGGVCDGFWIDSKFQGSAFVYSCFARVGDDVINTRWCSSPDLAASAVVAAAKAMATVFEGGG